MGGGLNIFGSEEGYFNLRSLTAAPPINGRFGVPAEMIRGWSVRADEGTIVPEALAAAVPDSKIEVLGLGWDMRNRLSPTEITSLGTDNAYIAAQYNGGMVLKSDGRVFAFGNNGLGQLGDARVADRAALQPKHLESF